MLRHAMRVIRRRVALACLAAGALACGSTACSSTPSDETPSGALQMFLDAMLRSDWDQSALREAHELLSPDAREALQQRAAMANALSGRALEPWQMLTQGRFRLRFAPRAEQGMVERIDGDRAVVIVTGSRDGERAEVPMVLEDGAWRVDLQIPPMRRQLTP